MKKQLMMGVMGMMLFAGCSQENEKEDVLKVICNHFRPEFINRMDEIIYFNNLKEDVCKELSVRYINEYQDKINIRFNEEEIINNTLKDPEIYKYGARGVKRKVKKEILKQLEKEIVYK